MPELKYKYICVEGNIGAGKSTLAKWISDKYGMHFLPEEFEENHLLPLFYSYPEKFAFSVEFSFLLDRFRQQMKWKDKLVSLRVVSDYYFEKCLYFAKVNLSERDYIQFEKQYYLLESEIVKPDLLIVVNTGIEDLLKNIKSRGREYEQDIKAEYLHKVNTQYIDSANKIGLFRRINIHLNDTSKETYTRLFERIESILEHEETQQNQAIWL